MASINRASKARNYTHEGQPAAYINAIEQLERSVMSCLLWEDEFYEDGASIAQRISELVGKCLPGDVVRIAIQAKEDMRLRHVPLLIAREMLRHKMHCAEFGRVAARIFTRADDICEFLAIYWKDNKDEPLAKQAKKHAGEAFRRFDEYQLAKYSGGQKAVKLRDAIRILRPIPANKTQSKLWKRLVKGELKTPDTWEVELSQSKDKKKSWTRLLKEEKLGGLAMLRNLRNMNQAGVDDKEIRKSLRTINAGRLLPINFIAAAKYNPQFEPVLEKQFEACFWQKPKMNGKTFILIDVSGSMDAAISGKSQLNRMDVACSLAIIAKEMFTDIRVFTFSNQLAEVPARKGFALRDAIINSQSHGGTDLGAALRALPSGYERLIVITDEQSHDPVPQMKGYLINVASNQNGIGYGQWVHIDGWSDKVLDYIRLHERGMDKVLKPKTYRVRKANPAEERVGKKIAAIFDKARKRKPVKKTKAKKKLVKKSKAHKR